MYLLYYNLGALCELTVCFCSQEGFTALHMASHEGKVDVVRLLTEAKAHINIQTEVYIKFTRPTYAWTPIVLITK